MKIPVIVFVKGKFRIMWFGWKLGLMLQFLPAVILKNKELQKLKEMKE